MSNHLHGGILFPTNSKYLNPFRQCKLSRDFAMDGEYTALTFTSIFNLRTQCDPRGAVGFQRAVGGSRPLVVIANAIKPRIEVFESLFPKLKLTIFRFLGNQLTTLILLSKRLNKNKSLIKTLSTSSDSERLSSNRIEIIE